MLVIPVFLTRHSSIKVRRENDCKGKTQILKIKKKKQYYQTLTITTEAFIRFQYILAFWYDSLTYNPFRSNICFYIIYCFFVFFFAFFLNLRRKFKLFVAAIGSDLARCSLLY